jgi:hypothetical protein
MAAEAATVSARSLAISNSVCRDDKNTRLARNINSIK